MERPVGCRMKLGVGRSIQGEARQRPMEELGTEVGAKPGCRPHEPMRLRREEIV
jgi:hypothetical protein